MTPRKYTLQYRTFGAAKDVGPYVIPFPKLPYKLKFESLRLNEKRGRPKPSSFFGMNGNYST